MCQRPLVKMTLCMADRNMYCSQYEWKITQSKNVLNAGVDDSSPIGSQILEYNLHFHINDKASRISLDKAFF